MFQHNRRSIRLKGYDYASEGAYFVAICSHKRIPLFGEVKKGEMKLNEVGEIVRDVWYETPVLRPNVELGEFVIMPDHIHGIIFIRWRDSEIVEIAPDSNPLPE
jgi:REP element-mobilizing transposase RayT